MLKELLLCASAVTMSAMPSRQANSRSHVVEQDGMAITYKYETNEVENLDDLIEGNIYHFSCDLQHTLFDLVEEGYLRISVRRINNFTIYDSYEDVSSLDEITDSSLTEDLSCEMVLSASSLLISSPSFSGYISYDLTIQTATCEFDFECLYLESVDLWESGISQYFSSSTYNEIESVDRVYPDNIFGFVSEFIDENILEGIPNIDNVSYTIGGQNITMRSWLNTSICVVLAILLISLLIFFVRYIFRLFASLLH